MVIHHTICFGQIQGKLYRISKKIRLTFTDTQRYAVVGFVQVVHGPAEVAKARLELARANAHGILNPERLPIPPLGQYA